MQRQRLQSTLVIAAVLIALSVGRALGQVGSERSALEPELEPESPRKVVKADLFVDDDNAGDQDGSARHPFNTVQQAIDAAADNGVVAVAGGVYPQNVRIRDKSVRLYGGYVGGDAACYGKGAEGNFGERDPATHPSHLQGDGKDSVVTMFDSGASVVDGFLVTGGGRSSVAAPSWVGGGFYIYQGSPTISNSVIEKNQTCPPVAQSEEKLGGGIYATGSKVSILNNVIRNNVSGRGAGVAADGPKVVVRGNTIENNVGVSDHGGGLYIFSLDAQISHNRIVGNEIGRAMGYGWGGGIVVFNKGGNYKLSHNIFTGNFAPSVGSAIFVDDGAVASLDHDLIYANACNPKGNGAVPAVYVDGSADGLSSSLHASHVTIADHTCSPTVAGNAITVTGNSKLTVTNSILWNNGGDDIDTDATSKATVRYTLAQEKLKGPGNISKDPLFADSVGHDYELRSTAGRWDRVAKDKTGEWVRDKQHSPAIDAADSTAPFKLEPAPNGKRANLGATGNTATASKSAP